MPFWNLGERGSWGPLYRGWLTVICSLLLPHHNARGLSYKVCCDLKLILGSGTQGPHTLKFLNFFEASLLISHQRLCSQSGNGGGAGRKEGRKSHRLLKGNVCMHLIKPQSWVHFAFYFLSVCPLREMVNLLSELNKNQSSLRPEKNILRFCFLHGIQQRWVIYRIHF